MAKDYNNGVTSYITDLHGNVEAVKATSTIMNHLGSKYGLELTCVDTGDFIGSNNDVSDLEKMNEAYGEFNGKVYGISGNHDAKIKNHKEILSNVKHMEWTSEMINGKIHYGVKHSSANIHEEEEESYKSLEENFEDVKKNLPYADIILMHEGIEEFSNKENEFKQYHKGLAELIKENKKSVVCGHNRSIKYEDKEEDSYWMRANMDVSRGADKDKAGMFFRFNYNGEERIIEMSYNDLIDWAKEINPEENFEFKEKPVKEKKGKVDDEKVMKELRDLEERVITQNKEMLKEYSEIISKPIDEFTEEDQEGLEQYVKEKDPKHYQEAIQYNTILEKIKKQEAMKQKKANEPIPMPTSEESEENQDAA